MVQRVREGAEAQIFNFDSLLKYGNRKTKTDAKADWGEIGKIDKKGDTYTIQTLDIEPFSTDRPFWVKRKKKTTIARKFFQWSYIGLQQSS